MAIKEDADFERAWADLDRVPEKYRGHPSRLADWKWLLTQPQSKARANALIRAIFKAGFDAGRAAGKGGSDGE